MIIRKDTFFGITRKYRSIINPHKSLLAGSSALFSPDITATNCNSQGKLAMRLHFALAFAVAWLIGWFAPNPTQPGMGLSAQADPDYYTRKRVNGVWITGKFPRANSTKRAAQVASADPTDVTVTNSIPTPVPVLPSMVGLAFPSYVSSSQTAEFPHDSGEAHREALRSGLEQLARRILANAETVTAAMPIQK
ncbi:hypothetical protein JKG68_29050 [Microvirga aerilata]|uniref:Uncharacterized protein n=1 Tax=Microvirga aerilata TaxID=670292 RepID=A0A936ZHR7_9HYPH|nr:hypothetical protein [Microvirga aerilata]MBL0407950.1 hypothetical protein [Microvirga aerilata]